MSTRQLDKILRLLPHDGMARMVNAISEVDETHITCTGSIPSHSPFADGNRARSLVLIELSAQAAACVVVEIGSDLTGHPVGEIEKHIAKAMAG